MKCAYVVTGFKAAHAALHGTSEIFNKTSSNFEEASNNPVIMVPWITITTTSG